MTDPVFTPEPLHPDAEKWFALYQEEVAKRIAFTEALEDQEHFFDEVYAFLKASGTPAAPKPDASGTLLLVVCPPRVSPARVRKILTMLGCEAEVS